ncbi:MAG: hypothetical protein WA705_15575 [Candidatus Ozemobacteraceae bacterium]
MSTHFSAAAASVAPQSAPPMAMSMQTSMPVPSEIPLDAPIERPHLTVVPATSPVSAPVASPVTPTAPAIGDPATEKMPEMAGLLTLYKSQVRECWLCAKIAGAFEAGKPVSEDDQWHFTTCVTSWARL